MNTGRLAEDRALAYLCQQGLTLVARNVRYSFGELDLVMRDDRTWVFVEVKYRSSSNFGGALQALSAAQQRRLRHAADHYLQRLSLDVPCRFDVVAITGDTLAWLPGAF